MGHSRRSHSEDDHNHATKTGLDYNTQRRGEVHIGTPCITAGTPSRPHSPRTIAEESVPGGLREGWQRGRSQPRVLALAEDPRAGRQRPQRRRTLALL